MRISELLPTSFQWQIVRPENWQRRPTWTILSGIFLRYREPVLLFPPAQEKSASFSINSPNPETNHMSHIQRTFDQLYGRKLSQQQESGFNNTVTMIAGIAGVPLAIFVHPLWLIASVMAALCYWFHRSMHGGVFNMNSPAARQACEFMVRVRQNGRDRSLLPLASADSIMQLANMERCENGAAGTGARIAQNLHFTCAHCQLAADPSVTGAWWAAAAEFKPFTRRAGHLRPDGTCAQCGASEGWFEATTR